MSDETRIFASIDPATRVVTGVSGYAGDLIALQISDDVDAKEAYLEPSQAAALGERLIRLAHQI